MRFETLKDVPETFTATRVLAAPGAERNAETVRRFLGAMELHADSAGEATDLSAYLAPDAIAVEFPNRFTPKGARRDVEAMRQAGERGRAVCPTQRFVVRSIVAVGDLVAVELEWIATVSMAIGSIPAGGEMRAQFGAFYEMRDGRIVALRNYDCFEEF